MKDNPVYQVVLVFFLALFMLSRQIVVAFIIFWYFKI